MNTKRKAVPSLGVGRLRADGKWVNLNGDYRYMEPGYYLSQDLENAGEYVRPTCGEILDAYVVPLCLEKAEQAALPVPEHYITNGFFEPPVIVDPLNPFMDRQRIVLKAASQEKAARSLTRNFTYAICCQELPAGSRVEHFRAVLGWSMAARYRRLAALVWSVFGLPLANVRVVSRAGEEPLFSRIKPLPCAQLNERELNYINEVVEWPT
jgi:hypothetical protein